MLQNRLNDILAISTSIEQGHNACRRGRSQKLELVRIIRRSSVSLVEQWDCCL